MSVHTNDSFASWTVLASFIVYYNSQGSIGLRMSQFSRSNRFRCNFSLVGRNYWLVHSAVYSREVLEMMAAHEDLSEGVWTEDIDNAALQEFEKHQNAFQRGFVKIMPYESVFPRTFLQFEKQVQGFEVRDDDV